MQEGESCSKFCNCIDFRGSVLVGATQLNSLCGNNINMIMGLILCVVLICNQI